MSSCDSTCVALAVCLSLVIFAIGCIVIYWKRNWIRKENVDKSKNVQEGPGVAQNNQEGLMFKRSPTDDIISTTNNEKPIEYYDVIEEQPPNPELEEARKRAESLERRLEGLSNEHTKLAAHAKNLQQEIDDLTKLNHEMSLI